MRHTCFLSHHGAVSALVGWALVLGCLACGPRVYAGALYRWVDAQGQVHLTDTPPPAPPGPPGPPVDHPRATAPAAEPQATPAPTPPPGEVVVEAVLNRRLTVPLRLDPGAAVTVLPKGVAEALGLTALDQLPIHPITTAGGVVHGPITSLRSLRVGSTEAREVNVAIDTAGQLPMGLLGQSFLRRFTMTVDHARGQVAFER
jgi:clan AA aspartic protease (TIGR02281 family)